MSSVKTLTVADWKVALVEIQKVLRVAGSGWH